jgi:hypothetical protein
MDLSSCSQNWDQADSLFSFYTKVPLAVGDVKPQILDLLLADLSLLYSLGG